MLDNDALAFSPEVSPSKDFKSGADIPKNDLIATHKEGGIPEMMIINHSIDDAMNIRKIQKDFSQESR